MSSCPSADATTADPPGRVERQLRELRQMTALCLRLATAVVEQVENPSADRAPICPDPGLTLTRLARVMRLNAAMETKIEEGRLVRIDAGDAVERMIEAEAEERAERGERYDSERLLADLDERLADDEAVLELAERPFEEIVQRLCQDIGVKFDPDLLEEEVDEDVVRALFPQPAQAASGWAALRRGVGPP